MESSGHRSLLFNPGPTNVAPEVRQALVAGDFCHREPEFFTVLKRVNERIVRILKGERTHSAVLFVASGTGANEAMLNGLQGRALLLDNGKYAQRLGDILDRYGIAYERFAVRPQQPIDCDAVERRLQEDGRFSHLVIVHHETTSGALAPLAKLGQVAKRLGVQLVVDAVSSLGGHPFDLQADNVAFCTVSANKCLESFPGVSFVIGRTAELQKMKGQARSYYFDLHHQWEKTRNGETPFTPAVQLVMGLDAALARLEEEGYDTRVLRYQRLARRMREGLSNLGLELELLPPDQQSNILTTLKMPAGFDYWAVHDELKKRGITIYSDANVLAAGRWRVATLGSITDEDVDWFLQNLKEVLGGSSQLEYPLPTSPLEKGRR